jgi:hypothetical protein
MGKYNCEPPSGLDNFLSYSIPVYTDLSSRYVFSYHPFYFDFHSVRIIFDVSSGFYLWNVNKTTM